MNDGQVDNDAALSSSESIQVLNAQNQSKVSHDEIACSIDETDQDFYDIILSNRSALDNKVVVNEEHIWGSFTSP